MTAITQKIPNFIGGISQQPDELKPEGSLREALNVIPDVTDGLRKRAGSRLINPLLTDQFGSWFHFNYADNQKYIGKVNTNGEVNLFSCADGLPVIVQYAEYDASEESNPDNNPSTGYPECSIADYNRTRLDWLATKRAYDEQNVIYNNLLDTANTTPTTDTIINYRVVEVNVRLGPDDGFPTDNYVMDQLVEGWVQIDGPDIKTSYPPVGYESKKGDLKLSDATILWDDEVYRGVSVYELLFVKTDYVPKDEANAEAAAQLDVVNASRGVMDASFSVFSVEAAKCGLADDTTASLKGLIQSNVVPTYLQHTRHNEIRTQVFGNRVFFVNPNIETGMNSNNYPLRQRENFIEINVAAAMQDYSIELVAEDTSVTPYTVVTAVEVIKGVFP